MFSLVWLTLQQDVWETRISSSAGNPVSRSEFQHVRGWRQQVSLAMNLVGGTSTARHTVLLLTGLAQNKAPCALLRGANKGSILLVSYGVNTLHTIYCLFSFRVGIEKAAILTSFQPLPKCRTHQTELRPSWISV